MPALVRVKIIAETGRHNSIVEYNRQKYFVETSNLSNYITRSTAEGFITYAYINSVFLTRKWQ